jgi:N-acetylmuramoyl-L-alanine amidase
MTIIDHPSPNHSPRKAGVRVDTVLLHHTASLDSWPSVEWLSNPKSGVSAHYVITNGGSVYRLVPEEMKAWHAGKGRLPWETCPEYDFNHRSIGIEVVNPGDGKTPFTEAQYTALAWLVPDILGRINHHYVLCSEGPGKRWSVAQSPMGQWAYILGHRDVAPGRKTDPADNFDWARIREALAPAPRVG